MNASVRPLKERFYTNDYDDDMLVSGEEAVRLVDETTLLVIVDVNKGEHTECPELIELAQSIVVIDHHRQAGDAIAKAVLFYIEPYASSASEMVAEICQYIGGGLKLRAAEAEAVVCRCNDRYELFHGQDRCAHVRGNGLSETERC